jgi:hypothetical protein
VDQGELGTVVPQQTKATVRILRGNIRQAVRRSWNRQAQIENGIRPMLNWIASSNINIIKFGAGGLTVALPWAELCYVCCDSKQHRLNHFLATVCNHSDICIDRISNEYNETLAENTDSFKNECKT